MPCHGRLAWFRFGTSWREMHGTEPPRFTRMTSRWNLECFRSGASVHDATVEQKHRNSSGVSTCDLAWPCNFRHEGETWIFTRRWTGAGCVLQVTGCSPGRVGKQRLSVLLTLAEQRFGNPELRLYKSVSVFPCRLIGIGFGTKVARSKEPSSLHSHHYWNSRSPVSLGTQIFFTRWYSQDAGFRSGSLVKHCPMSIASKSKVRNSTWQSSDSETNMYDEVYDQKAWFKFP